MNRILLSLIIAPLFSLSATAQFSYGIKSGISLASMSNIEQSKFRTGYFAGGVAEYSFCNYFGLQTELLYSLQGVQFNGETTVGDMMGIKTEGALRINYINIPLLAKFRVMEGLWAEAGPQFGFAVMAKSKLDMVDHESMGFHKMDRDTYKTHDTSLAFGFSVGCSEKVRLVARYQLGLTDVTSGSRNRVLQLGLDYRFR